VDLRIEEIDPRDDDDFARWFAPFDAAQRHDLRLPGLWSVEGQRGISVTTHATRRLHWVAVSSTGEAVGSARLNLPERDNTHVASVFVAVSPAHRRRGVGTALLDVATAAASEHARTTIQSFVDEPHGEVAPGVEFLRKHGFAPALAEVRRDLTLPADEARLAVLELAARSQASAYSLVTWHTAVPEALLADRAALYASISTDAPPGDLDVRAEVWDGARVRASEEQARAMGRHLWATGAVDAAERLVGVTELTVTDDQPDHLWQWDTVVLPAHRGHALGTLLKIANLRYAVEQWPSARLVTTYNAADNAHMIRVNEALGFVPVQSASQWQRSL